MNETESDDAAFIAVMELAIDWRLEITDEQWKRYQKLMEKEGRLKAEEK